MSQQNPMIQSTAFETFNVVISSFTMLATALDKMIATAEAKLEVGAAGSKSDLLKAVGEVTDSAPAAAQNAIDPHSLVAALQAVFDAHAEVFNLQSLNDLLNQLIGMRHLLTAMQSTTEAGVEQMLQERTRSQASVAVEQPNDPDAATEQYYRQAKAKHAHH